MFLRLRLTVHAGLSHDTSHTLVPYCTYRTVLVVQYQLRVGTDVPATSTINTRSTYQLYSRKQEGFYLYINIGSGWFSVTRCRGRQRVYRHQLAYCQNEQGGSPCNRLAKCPRLLQKGGNPLSHDKLC